MTRPLSSVLFACSLNSIRSPMAASLLRQGRRLHVDSVGVRTAPLDPFVLAVMQEIGIDLSVHRPKAFEDLDDTSFDLILSLSPQAQHMAAEITRTMDCAIEFWPVPDPSVGEGSREMRLAAYRGLRDHLSERIERRFPAALYA